VSWLPTPGIVASLLGRVQAVVTPPGALAWDAARAGVPVYPPLPAAGDLRALARQRLAATLPALLASDPDFLVALLTSLLEQSEPGPFGTAAWLRQAYATPRGSPPEARWRRKLLKLRRDPLAFWADSWLGRRARGTRAGP
jgi:hypothetical protein